MFDGPKPRIEAHLGHGSHGVSAQEFAEAVQAGASLVEMDVQATADDHLLVYHHYTLPDGRWVHEAHFRDCIDTLSLGASDPPIRLEDAIALAVDHEVGLTLDIKSGMGDEHVVHRLLAKALRNTSVAHPEIHLCDWDHGGLGIVKQAIPHVFTRGALRGRPLDIVDLARRAGVDGLNLAWDCTRPSDVAALHKAGFSVAFFGGWGDRYVPYAVATGVDILSTDDPKESSALL